MKKYLKWIRTVLLALLLAFVFRSYLFASYVVDGESMEPTLYDGNLLMVNKAVYDWSEIDRQQVIVFHANEEEDYVKRVIGIPGDEIEFKNDQLYVNGVLLEESYLDDLRPNDGLPFTEDFTLEEATGSATVPEGHLFVMGDNRRDSLDSRYFGFVPEDTVVGKVDIRYWPFSQAGIQFN
ncbi:signal peptidase I [Halobacillus litoralis]|uniref:Signal peptidase I n=1 Tax=Halobacillus litoralis TaxID=45668 RepID=A0A845DN92_9BACI|nr:MULTISPECIES: signal peptidase I [Halobacillus]MYL18409.1 signal peptidase I [Halobacillus litoralis]MYL30584.1 signal peptidase I [Halobacillus halophilus]MYL38601.1 signal peptidase I [Halobacillus litoralis]